MLPNLRAGMKALVICTAVWIPQAAHTQERLPEGVDPASGFRMERYRAPVPDFIPGGRIVTSEDVRRLAMDGQSLLVDVYPPRGTGPDPIDDAWRNTEIRLDIAGSIWLPDVGRGYLEAALEAYFRRNLARLTGSDLAHPLIFYCTADCWQGWNAARRAIVWGYTAVHWYPEGTDGWTQAGGKTVEAVPVNFQEGE